MILNTIGYQGADIPDFISALKKNNIDLLIDVRENANSRKKGFAKSALRETLQTNGIRYVHLRGLGTKPEVRKAYRANNDMDWFTSEYNQYLSTRQEDIDELVKLMADNTCCLMCFEADHTMCHRSLITAHLKKQFGQELEINHIQVTE